VAFTDLIRAGVLVETAGALGLHPSLAHDLEILAQPQVLVRTWTRYRTAAVTAVHALAGSLGGGLVMAGDRVELSMFPAYRLGTELVRLVPEIPRLPANPELARSGEFSVTHVVTLGSPVRGMAVPPSVQVQSLENAHDIVPHLDAKANPDLPNWTTVSIDRGTGDITDNHDVRASYEPIAADVDQLWKPNDGGTPDPSVSQFLNSAGAFLAGSGITTQAFSFLRSTQHSP